MQQRKCLTRADEAKTRIFEKKKIRGMFGLKNIEETVYKRLTD